MNGLVILRLFVIAIALALAVALIARGNMLIGFLVGALALARLAMFVTMMRRRRIFGERFPRRWNQPPRRER